jgi:hypothetical protein
MNDLLETLVQALQAQAGRSRGFLSDSMARALATVAIETVRQHQRGIAVSGGADGDEPGQERWQATGELRWFAEHRDQPVRLQQAFLRLEDGHVDWREVPLVVAQPG